MVSESVSECLLCLAHILFVAFFARYDINDMIRGAGKRVSNGMCGFCDMTVDGVRVEGVRTSSTTFVETG